MSQLNGLFTSTPLCVCYGSVVNAETPLTTRRETLTVELLGYCFRNVDLYSLYIGSAVNYPSLDDPDEAFP